VIGAKFNVFFIMAIDFIIIIIIISINTIIVIICEKFLGFF